MKKMMILKWFLLIATLLFLLPGASLASAPTPEPTSVPVPAGLDIFCPKFSHRNDLPLFKDKLFKLGYYIENVSNADLISDYLDIYTMMAIQEACRKNSLGFEYHEEGINRTVWDAVMNDRLVHANTTAAPTPVTYTHIYWQENSQSVKNVQAKLMELGYPLPSGSATGIYDDGLRGVIDVYCQLNSYPYDQAASNGLTVAFQSRLLEQPSVAYYTVSPTPEITVAPTATAVPSTGDRIRTYFAGSTNVMGLQLPTVAVWLVALALIAGCIIAIIHFFSPSDPNADRPGSDKPTRRQTGGSGRLEFTIEYKGIVQNYRCDIDHALKIGRNVGEFPLNMQDTLISRKHCEIYYSNRNLMLRDYSSNGTRINGRLCSREEYLLSNGDVIQIGNHTITIRF